MGSFWFLCRRASLLFRRIGLAAAQALGKRGAHVVVSSRRQANVDKAVALLQSQSIQVTGTTCNVGKGEDREKLVQMVRFLMAHVYLPVILPELGRKYPLISLKSTRMK